MNTFCLIAAFGITVSFRRCLIYVAIAIAVLLVLYLLLSPRAMVKFIAGILRHTFLRLRIYGAENIPDRWLTRLKRRVYLEKTAEAFAHVMAE